MHVTFAGVPGGLRVGAEGVCAAVIRTCWRSMSVRLLAQPGNLSPHSRSAIRDAGEARIPSPAPRGAPLSHRPALRRLNRGKLVHRIYLRCRV